jgi:hypothetical protein
MKKKPIDAGDYEKGKHTRPELRKKQDPQLRKKRGSQLRKKQDTALRKKQGPALRKSRRQSDTELQQACQECFDELGGERIVSLTKAAALCGRLANFFLKNTKRK